jgi:hypothetical protein
MSLLARGWRGLSCILLLPQTLATDEQHVRHGHFEGAFFSLDPDSSQDGRLRARASSGRNANGGCLAPVEVGLKTTLIVQDRAMCAEVVPGSSGAFVKALLSAFFTMEVGLFQ